MYFLTIKCKNISFFPYFFMEFYISLMFGLNILLVTLYSKKNTSILEVFIIETVLN